MPCIPMQIKPNKSPLRNRVKVLLPLERLATFPPQADHVLVDLFSSLMRVGGGEGCALWEEPLHRDLLIGASLKQFTYSTGSRPLVSCVQCDTSLDPLMQTSSFEVPL